MSIVLPVIVASTAVVAALLVGRSSSAAGACSGSRPLDPLPTRAIGPPQTRWSRTDLGAGKASYSTGLNDHGQVVGFGSTGFLWDAGELTAPLTGLERPIAITRDGQVVGWGDAEDGWTHTFLWEDGRVRDLGTLGGPEAWPEAVNACGQVVGASDVGDPESTDWDAEQVRHAFLWRSGEMLDLGTLGGPSSYARDINDRGQVVGVADTSSGQHAFLWQDGEMRDLGTLGGPSSSAVAVNDRGQVVGVADTATKAPDGEHLARPFLWQDGMMTDIGSALDARYVEVAGINERGQVLGFGWDKADEDPKSGEIGSVRVFLWEHGSLTDVGRADDSDPPVQLNDRGQVAGSTGNMQPFLWQNGSRAVYRHEGTVTAINNAGQIAGDFWGPSSESIAVVWTPTSRGP